MFARYTIIRQCLIAFEPERRSAGAVSTTKFPRPFPISRLLFCYHAIQGETTATGDEDCQRAAHDGNIHQKIIVLADLLRAGRVFPITMCERSSDHHKREYQNCAV